MKVEIDILQKLGQAPKDLTAAYDQIYTLIEDEEDYGRETAKCALMWVLCTMKPLTMEMLLEATRYATRSQDEVSPETLLDLCRNLLTWDKSEKSNVVQFAHLSVKEYLIAKKWTEAEAHAIAARSCLVVLTEKTHELELTHRYMQVCRYITNLPRYADVYWLEHVSKSFIELSRTAFKEPLCSFLGTPALLKSDYLPSPSYANWIRRRLRSMQSWESGSRMRRPGGAYESEPPNPIFLVAACDFLVKFTDEFWPQWGCFDLHSRNLNGESLLYVAAYHGNSAIVTRLLAHDTIDVNARSKRGITPLYIAAARGHAETVQQLLAHSAIDVNMKGGVNQDGVIYPSSPLFIAAARGHAEMVQQLLAHSAIDVNMRGIADKNDGSPLFVAAARGHSEMVQQLLAHSAIDVNLQNGCGETALFKAAKQYRAEILQWLLDRCDVDINLPDKEGETALFAAIRTGNECAFLKLTAHAAINPHLRNKKGETVLVVAITAKQQSAEVLQWLLDQCDVNSQDNEGETALFAAIRTENECAFLKLTAHAAINPHLRNKKGETVLMVAIAAKQQSAEVLQWLLDQCDVSSQDNEGETALSIAARSGNERIVQQLLARKAIDVNLTNVKGETCLIIAAKEGHVKVVRELLENCPDIDVCSGVASFEGYLTSAIPTLHSSMPPVLLGVLLGNGNDDDKVAIAQEIIQHLMKHTSKIPSTYHDWARHALANPTGLGKKSTLLESLSDMVTQSDITEAIHLGIRNGTLTSLQLRKLLEVSPSNVEIRKDIMIAATPTIAIPTINRIEPTRATTRPPGLAQVLISSPKTTFDLDAYLYSSREWHESTSKFR